MPAQSKTIQVYPTSELGQVLREFPEGSTLLEMNGARYRVTRIDAPAAPDGAPRRRRPSDRQSDPLLGLIGLLDAGEPTDIAQSKDQLFADAVDRRGE